MRRYLTYSALGVLFCIPATGQKPTPEQQRQTLDTAREIAIHYASKLPNFMCNEQVERTDQLQRAGQLLSVSHYDHLIIQLSYAGQKETTSWCQSMEAPLRSRFLHSMGLSRAVNSAACNWACSTRRPPRTFSGRKRQLYASIAPPFTRTASPARIRTICWGAG